ncbi:hypothetical protein V496_07825 [Pseudogymnoascus sp. VKM F-4515 (FW-2607)]|nr:hypothetical protein V496_07825 [Pseudogymnoascus sp. VKM F-4515 (FW-2607)]
MTEERESCINQFLRWRPARINLDVLGSVCVLWSTLDAATVSGWCGIVCLHSLLSNTSYMKTGAQMGSVGGMQEDGI